ncbi:MAG: gliding motility lipoprotein GldH [Muribaculaceae bacterium]|nr:gliding motility lipoprotein GldH [Muribaculaceae bacterium]
MVAAGLIALAACCAACDPSQASQGQYVHLPDAGWDSALPLRFTPSLPDSTASYDLTVAVRHSTAYGYRNLNLVVDLIDDSARVERHKAHFVLADDYGNWLGTGFGTLYQSKLTVARRVPAGHARRVVVWQSMTDCPVLHGVEDVGLITKKAE